VQEGEGIVYLGGTSKAQLAAQVVDDSDWSSVIEEAANTAFSLPHTPPTSFSSQPTQFMSI
jgi:hypothetical protein